MSKQHNHKNHPQAKHPKVKAAAVRAIAAKVEKKLEHKLHPGKLHKRTPFREKMHQQHTGLMGAHRNSAKHGIAGASMESRFRSVPTKGTPGLPVLLYNLLPSAANNQLFFKQFYNSRCRYF
jgi:hypothetical protein